MTDRIPDMTSEVTLLRPGDPAPVEVTNAGGKSPFLLLGDHAGRAIPHKLGRLGLAPEALNRHIAWDIGVAGMGKRLAHLLDACFIHQAYSRLVIDCNRQPGAPDSVPPVSDQTPIPGNAGLSEAEAAARCAEIYQPYHSAITAELDRRARESLPTMLISLHSFTPFMQGVPRPWRFGVLHRNDSALSARMLNLLRAEFGAEAGDNEPYSLDAKDNTIPLHADPRGLDYLELEVRQDLIADENGQHWAAVLIAKSLNEAQQTTSHMIFSDT